MKYYQCTVNKYLTLKTNKKTPNHPHSISQFIICFTGDSVRSIILCVNIQYVGNLRSMFLRPCYNSSFHVCLTNAFITCVYYISKYHVIWYLDKSPIYSA